MKNVFISEQKTREKWANLVFGYLLLLSVFITILLVLLN